MPSSISRTSIGRCSIGAEHRHHRPQIHVGVIPSVMLNSSLEDGDSMWVYASYVDYDSGSGLPPDIADRLLRGFECGTYGGSFPEAQHSSQEVRDILAARKCCYCHDDLHEYSFDDERNTNAEQMYLQIKVCKTCGWWNAVRRADVYTKMTYKSAYIAYSISKGVGARLRELDVDDVNVPLDELRRYLLAKYSSRMSMNPRRFEEIVGGVFSDFGYVASVTSYSGDDGIDVALLESSSGTRIGVQVKRYQGKIGAEQIRSLAGAMILNGFTQGIFVTTSTFTRGARNTADRYTVKGTPIGLVDADRFFDYLSITQRRKWTSEEIDQIRAEVEPKIDSMSIFSFDPSAF